MEPLPRPPLREVADRPSRPGGEELDISPAAWSPNSAMIAGTTFEAGRMVAGSWGSVGSKMAPVLQCPA
jgi:hypothetical protein